MNGCPLAGKKASLCKGIARGAKTSHGNSATGLAPDPVDERLGRGRHYIDSATEHDRFVARNLVEASIEREGALA